MALQEMVSEIRMIQITATQGTIACWVGSWESGKALSKLCRCLKNIKERYASRNLRAWLCTRELLHDFNKSC